MDSCTKLSNLKKKETAKLIKIYVQYVQFTMTGNTSGLFEEKKRSKIQNLNSTICGKCQEHYSGKCHNNYMKIVLSITHCIISFDRRIKGVNFMTTQ